MKESSKLVLSVVRVAGAEGCDVCTEEEDNTEQDKLVWVLNRKRRGLAGLQSSRICYLGPATNISHDVQQRLALLDRSTAEHVGVFYPQVIQAVHAQRFQLPVQFFNLLLSDKSCELLSPEQVRVEEGADL